MNEHEKEAAVEELAGDTGRKVNEWWHALTRRAKKAVLRREERTAVKKAARAAKSSFHFPAGYQCPKCHAWHSTPDARLACRVSHHQVEAAS